MELPQFLGTSVVARADLSVVDVVGVVRAFFSIMIEVNVNVLLVNGEIAESKKLGVIFSLDSSDDVCLDVFTIAESEVIDFSSNSGSSRISLHGGLVLPVGGVRNLINANTSLDLGNLELSPGGGVLLLPLDPVS